jgi:hypothetical protein
LTSPFEKEEKVLKSTILSTSHKKKKEHYITTRKGTNQILNDDYNNSYNHVPFDPYDVHVWTYTPATTATHDVVNTNVSSHFEATSCIGRLSFTKVSVPIAHRVLRHFLVVYSK